MVHAVSPSELKAMLRDGRELALLDAREEGAFGERHLLFAVSLPLSRLEMRVAALVPRRSVRIVVCDGGEGVAARAAARLAALGYRDVGVLDGGIDAWGAAGYETFSGVNVPSKAFGEMVEARLGTPHVSPRELEAILEAGEDVVVLDSRPLEEFRAMSIPGALDCPGAELVYRAPALVASPDTLVVVNCAGRTRSIIGAQSLIDAGLENRVVALENGTMGWHLAGLRLDRGRTDHAPRPTPDALGWSQRAAARVADRHGVRRIDGDGIATLSRDAERTLYLLDVRTPAEYEAGHLPGARCAPGGQLVQATDAFVGTRNAQLVLIDADRVRAPMTAAWLRRMGWDDVYAFALPHRDGDDLDVEGLETGPERAPVLGLDAIDAEQIGGRELQAALAAGSALAIDLADSRTYRRGHVPGAWFAIRARLGRSYYAIVDAQKTATLVALVSPDGALARLAWPEVRVLAGEGDDGTRRRVVVLEGGTGAWREAGLPLVEGDERLADDRDDLAYRPYEQDGPAEEAMRRYLSWEVELPARIERDGDAAFRP